MICSDIIQKIEERYPTRYALEWDNVGLLAGRMDKEIKKIYIALDATDEVIDEAVTWGADMLLTHHPMIFKPVKRVTDQDFIGRRLMKMIQNDLSYYAMHTNYDVKGMAALVAEYLDMEGAEVLDVTSVENGIEEGIGRVGSLKCEMTLAQCCGFVKEKLMLPNVKVFGNLETKVKRIAVSPGSGKSAISDALAKQADVLVTGDVDHHEGIDAVAQGLTVIDAGHYGTEYIYVEDMHKFCQVHFPQIEIKTAPVKHPFQVL